MKNAEQNQESNIENVADIENNNIEEKVGAVDAESKEINEGNKRMRILMGMDCYLPDVDGVVNCMHNYCTNLSRYADVVAMAPSHKDEDKVVTSYDIIRAKSMHMPLLNCSYGRPKKDKKFNEKIMAGDYDIVHIHSPFNMSRYAVKVARAKNIPCVITYHSNIKSIIKRYAKFNWLTNAISRGIHKIYDEYDLVYVCSKKVEEQLRDCGYKGKVEYLPFGTDLPRVSAEEIAKNRARAKEVFNVNEDEVVLIYVGRVMELKRIDFSLKALKVLKEQGIKFKFFVVGKGKDLEKLKKLSKKLGFTDEEVIFTGFLERELLPVINSRADLLLFPSIYDNFGLVKVEAAAYNTAGVFVEDTCAGDGIVDGENGFLCKNTVEDYANTIKRAISDRENLKKIGERAGETLYISWEDCTKELYKAYERVLNKSDNNKND